MATSAHQHSHRLRTEGQHSVTALSAIERRDVHFYARDETRLEAWLYLPQYRSSPVPAITMANGFGTTRWHRVDQFARAFAHAGFAVLLHDHRNFGTSGGVERGDVDPWCQISDWEDAISYLQALPEILDHRIGLWGSGYAGGHALVLGATDRRLAAIVSQVPTLNGMTSGGNSAPDSTHAMAHGLLREDCRLHLTRDPGLRLTLASPNPAIPAPYRSPDALAFYHHREAADIWLNEITVRSLRASMSYIPEAWIRRVAPTPLMLLTAADDSAALGDPGNKIGEEGGNIETVAVPGGPFESFFGQFTNASMAATRWFRRHL